MASDAVRNDTTRVASCASRERLSQIKARGPAAVILRSSLRARASSRAKLDIAVKSNLMRVYELQQPNGLDSWSLAKRPIPKPKRGRVLVKIRAVSLNYRDILIATGRYGSAPLPAALIPLSDGAGEVVEVGSDVS